MGRSAIIRAHNIVLWSEGKWRLSGIIPLNFDGHHFKMISKCDDGILNPLFYNNSYIETSDIRVFINLIQKSNVILDIGANTGIYSIISSMVSDDTVVYSFEPNPVNYIRLNRNIVLNKRKNIKTIQKAVGPENSKIVFTVPAADILSDTSSAIESFSKSTYSGTIEWKNIEVDQITVDDFCVRNTIHKVDLMKIDVEGYEIDVLRSAMKTIQKDRPIILLESFLNEEKRIFLEGLVVQNQYYVYLIISEGIVKTNQKFERNTGLNYLLLPFETPDIFTPMTEIITLQRIM